jgi:hypothetical protein
MRNARISILNTRMAYNSDEEDSLVLDKACDGIKNLGKDRPDLILLSEIFSTYVREETPAYVKSIAQSVPGPLSDRLSLLAKEFNTYIAFGMFRKDGDDVFNSLVLLDRNGNHVWTYDKMTPVICEMDDWGIKPGGYPQSYECDFGRIGAAICFDINFLELAEIYSRQKIELLLFSSVFPGGRLVDIWALRYGFAVACSTYCDNNKIMDCTGTTISKTSNKIPHITGILNLNRRIVHMDGNLEKLEKIRDKYAGDVLIEDMRDEGCCILRSLKPGLEVDSLFEEYGVEYLDSYFTRSRKVREQNGGFPCFDYNIKFGDKL